jgi:hypothetical protein
MPVTAEQLIVDFQSGELKPVEFVQLAGEVPIVELAKLRDALFLIQRRSSKDQISFPFMASWYRTST